MCPSRFLCVPNALTCLALTIKKAPCRRSGKGPSWRRWDSNPRPHLIVLGKLSAPYPCSRSFPSVTCGHGNHGVGHAEVMDVLSPVFPGVRALYAANDPTDPTVERRSSATTWAINLSAQSRESLSASVCLPLRILPKRTNTSKPFAPLLATGRTWCRRVSTAASRLRYLETLYIVSSTTSCNDLSRLPSRCYS